MRGIRVIPFNHTAFPSFHHDRKRRSNIHYPASLHFHVFYWEFKCSTPLSHMVLIILGGLSHITLILVKLVDFLSYQHVTTSSFEATITAGLIPSLTTHVISKATFITAPAFSHHHLLGFLALGIEDLYFGIILLLAPGVGMMLMR